MASRFLVHRSRADGTCRRDLTVWALSQAEFMDLTVRNLEVKINYQTSPPTAETTFTVWVRGKDRSGIFPGEIARPVAMKVKLRKESGRWLVFDTPPHDFHE